MKFVILSCILFALTGHASGVEIVKEIRVFDAIDLTNAKDVVSTTGKHSGSPAYRFGPKTDHLIVNAKASSIFTKQAFLTSDFTVSALVKTKRSRGGTILSIDAKAGTSFAVYFKWSLGPAGPVVNLAVAYIASGGVDHPQPSKTIPVPGLLENKWLSISVRVHTVERFIRFAINDTFYGQVLLDKPMDKFPSGSTLRLAQQKGKGSEASQGLVKRFVGDLQDVVISFGISKCLGIKVRLPPMSRTTPKPTCPTQPTPSNKCVDESGKKRNDKEKWNEGPCVKCVCKMGKGRCVRLCKV